MTPNVDTHDLILPNEELSRIRISENSGLGKTTIQEFRSPRAKHDAQPSLRRWCDHVPRVLRPASVLALGWPPFGMSIMANRAKPTEPVAETSVTHLGSRGRCVISPSVFQAAPVRRVNSDTIGECSPSAHVSDCHRFRALTHLNQQQRTSTIVHWGALRQ
jgi:hypothetical protein